MPYRHNCQHNCINQDIDYTGSLGHCNSSLLGLSQRTSFFSALPPHWYDRVRFRLQFHRKKLLYIPPPPLWLLHLRSSKRPTLSLKQVLQHPHLRYNKILFCTRLERWLYYQHWYQHLFNHPDLTILYRPQHPIHQYSLKLLLDYPRLTSHSLPQRFHSL
jgi:hypothetical protein